ncbi:hypothetical protein HRbin36_01499 [bacterium HR36]|nr:hypothetical protein HRbin36_01499 [bacterium HR36]
MRTQTANAAREPENRKSGQRLRWMAKLAAMLLAVMALWALAGQEQAEETHTFQIRFGLRDAEPRDWSGSLQVTGGRIVSASGWRTEAKDSVQWDAAQPQQVRWQIATHSMIAPGERYRLQVPGQPTPQLKMTPWAAGLLLTLAGKDPQCQLRLAGGDVTFRASQVRLGKAHLLLDGQVAVVRVPPFSLVRPADSPKTPHPRQDDYPALWVSPQGQQYLAWCSYQREKDRVLLAWRDGMGDWSHPLEIAGPGDHFRVAVAGNNEGLWVVWASQREGHWQLYGRHLPVRSGQPKPAALSAVVQLTEGTGPHFWHRMCADGRGRVWLVWQGFQNGQSDIWVRCAIGRQWSPPHKVSTSEANDWDPAVVADTKTDRVWIAWDSYAPGYYAIRVRPASFSEEHSRIVFGADEGEALGQKPGWFQAHASLACDNEGRVWLAWDEGTPNWGKDYGLLFSDRGGTGLYAARCVRVRVRTEQGWQRPAQEITAALPAEMREFQELPQLQTDSQGRVWLGLRYRICRRPRDDGWAAAGRWEVAALCWLGDRWSEPIPLEASAGRNDMRLASGADARGRVYFAYPSDNRGWAPPLLGERNLHLTVSVLAGELPVAAPKLLPVETPMAAPPAVHPKEAQEVARIREYRIRHGGKTYRIVRGDLHRHTDISNDGVGDGSLMDLHRYAWDAAALDFVLVGDHNMGHDREYPWWRTQKANDLYSVPGRFLSLYGYERSVRYPNGHRNVIWTERGHRTLPLPNPAIPGQMAKDTDRLYAYLRETGGICTPHSSATEQGTDWRQCDGTLEPVVELFQGFQSAYEMENAPLSIDAQTKVVHESYQPSGFVVNALAKGYRLGFQASSDHVSTHVSYACVLVEEFSRQGIVEALRQRHCYAATDNIILDVRAQPFGIMGDEIAVPRPVLDIRVIGTGPIDRVEIVRNGQVVYRYQPERETAEVHLRYEDQAPVKARISYYYVRVQQKNRHMAWASPIWMRIAP